MCSESTLETFAELKWRAVARRDAAIARATPEDVMRFFSRVDKTDICWIFQGARWGEHRRFSVHGEQVAAHRAAKIWETGLPGGKMLVCHRCHNGACVRPSHLYWGSYRENLNDRNLSVPDFYERQSGERAHNATLHDDEVKEIYRAYHLKGQTITELAKSAAVPYGIVDHIVRGLSWRRVTQQLCRARKTDGMACGERAGLAKLTETQVLLIRRSFADGISNSKQAKIYDVSKQTIGAIVSRKTWRHI